jgi:hypothetical protein
MFSIVIGFFLFSAAPAAFAILQDDAPNDRIILKSGATIQGRVIEEKTEAGRKILVVKLKSGGTISLDRARLVDRIRNYDALDAEYERKLATTANEPAAYWEIIKWCEEQPSGRSRFKNERQFLLEKIIELDPNDKTARRRLGYEEKNGRWVLENAWFEEHGYKKSGTTWQSNLISEFRENRISGDEMRKQKRAELDSWFRRFEKAKTTPDEARIEILNMADETVVAVLLQKIMDADKTKKEVPLRRIFMEAFSKVPNRDSVRALSYLAVHDSESGIRDRALVMLKQPGFDRELAASFLAGHLAADNDALRDRTAYVIGELGVVNHFMSLVNALETQRTVVVNPDAGRMNLAAGQGGVGMQAPAAPVTRQVTVRSEAALTALKKLSRADYGFNKEAWQGWYIRNHTLYDTQVRTDD